MSNDQVSTSASVSQQPARWGDGKTVLVMLVGGPGAGKSTLAKLAGDQWTVVSETRGETRGETHGEAHGEKASASLPSASLSVVRRIVQAVGAGKHVLLDRCNVTRAQRSEVVSMLRNRFGWKTKERVYVVHMNTSLDVCIARARGPNRS